MQATTWNIYSLAALFQKIEQNTKQQNICLSTIIHNLQAEYQFELFNLNHVLSLLQQQNSKQFMCICFRLIISKLLYDMIVEKTQLEFREQIKTSYRQLLPFIYKFTQEKCSKIIKKLYCEIISGIKHKKSQIIQYFLFIIFLSTQKAIKLIFNSCDIIRQMLASSLEVKQEKLSIWICVMLNYQITNFKVSSDIYFGLKKKYIKGLKQGRRRSSTKTIKTIKPQNRGSKFKKSAFGCFNRTRQIQTSLREQYQHILSPQDQQFFQEIHKIIMPQQKTTTVMPKNATKKRETAGEDRKIFTDSSLSIFRQSYPRQISFPCRAKKSAPFSEIKLNNYTERVKDGKKRHNIQSLISERSGKNKENKQSAKKIKNYLFIASSISMIMQNQKDKKSDLLKAQKEMSLQNWKNKIKHIRYQSNIQKSAFFNYKRKNYRKSTSTLENQHENNFQFKFKQTKQEAKNQNTGSCTPTIMNGFAEHIQTRQPCQIKIIKDIVNFTSYSPDRKHKRISSRQFKVEYENFLKDIAANEQFYNEDNFQLRLQKCITGANKL